MNMFLIQDRRYQENTFQRPMSTSAMMMMKLITRVLEKIFGSLTVPGVGFGASTCWVPQIGHIRTPSRSSVPHFLQIIYVIS